MSSLKVQPLTSQNRSGVSQLLFDSHMRSVPASFQFLKLRPMAFLIWTAISTAIFKYRKTHLQNYGEILVVLSGSVILAQSALFLALLYEASTQAPGPEVVGKLDEFLDQDLNQDQDQSEDRSKKTSGTRRGEVEGERGGVNNDNGVKKRTVESSSSGSEPASATSSAQKKSIDNNNSDKKGNKFWVLEKNQEPIGCIGALVDKTKGEAELVSWAVVPRNQRNGAGTLLLKTAMDQLSGMNNQKKTKKVEKVRVVLQGSQIPALRLFHKLGFVQVDRSPEWLGEKVVLEMGTKDWLKAQNK
ncbi:hypothetical protein BGX28_003923 [Mortierella sp. GBA30]|nr:hypothetical protein BGX28_003923 [Mortierella sp. GBA30]